jgi:signal transduction histidine kinase
VNPISSNDRSARQSSAERALISEIFHALSQPLTALQCSLDLALRRDRTWKQLRASVQTALDHAERLRQRLLLARALNAAFEPAETEIINFGELLGELHEEMAPLFESFGKRLELRICGEPVFVGGNKSRLRQALFVLIDYLLRYSASEEPLRMELSRSEQHQAQLRIEASSCLPVSPGGEPRVTPCEIELARRTFVAAGGDFRWPDQDSRRGVWLATLPTT